MKYKFFIISFLFILLSNISIITVNADVFAGSLVCSYDYYDINDYFDASKSNTLKEKKIGTSNDTITCFVYASFFSEGQSHFFKELAVSFNNNDPTVSLQFFEPNKEWDSVINQNGTYILKDTNDSIRNATRHNVNYIGKAYFKLDSSTKKGNVKLLSQLKDMVFENNTIHPFIELVGNYEYDNDYNTKLKELTVNGKIVPLKDNEFNYSVELPYEIEEAVIHYVSQTHNPSITITGDKNLKVGDNIFKIKLSTIAGNSNEYTLNIKRMDEKYGDATLKSLTIEGYDIKFDKDTDEYQITIKNEKKLNIKATPNSDLSKVSIIGNNDLEDGCHITIKVTAANKTTKKYKILIKQDETKDNKTTIIILLAATNIGLLTYIIIDKTKRNKKAKQENTQVENIEEKTRKTQKKTLK